jgi:DNA polymerase
LEVGLSPQKDVYICNILKCQPPSNRRPSASEIASCSTHLQDQLALWAGDTITSHKQQLARHARVLVALGNTAATALTGSPLGITALRGQWKLYRGRIMVMPTYHPSYLLRPFKTQARAKEEARNDLLEVLKYIGLSPAERIDKRPRLYAIDGGKTEKTE